MKIIVDVNLAVRWANMRLLPSIRIKPVCIFSLLRSLQKTLDTIPLYFQTENCYLAATHEPVGGEYEKYLVNIFAIID